MPIDMNRPCMTRAKFDRDGKAGPKISMYKDQPGVYYDAHGKEVPAVIAKAAGYDIEEMETRKSVLGERNRLLERYEMMTGPKPPRVVVEVRPKGHKLVKVGPDQYHIEDADGQLVTSDPQPRSYAIIWLDDIDALEEGAEEEKLDVYPVSSGEVELHKKEVVLPAPEPVEEEEPLLFPSTKSKK